MNLADPTQATRRLDDYALVAQLIERLQGSEKPAPTLEILAAEIGLSASATQRLFSRWAGISPKRFQQYLTAQSLKQRLPQSDSLLSLSLDENLSSTSRVHDHFVQMYGVSPGSYQSGGKQLTITHGLQDSPFGTCHIGISDKGICWLAFLHPVDLPNAESQLQGEWPNATLQRDDAAISPYIEQIFTAANAQKPLFVHVKGSNFQLKVWEALLRIPQGDICSYGQLAEQLGYPRAGRAVGTAIGQNPIAWLIPCHRVIRNNGIIGVYRWGSTRKKAMLAWETPIK